MKPNGKPPCSFPGCERPNNSRGLCSSHVWQRNRGHTLTPIVKLSDAVCSGPECERTAQTRGRFAGLCSTHARQKRESGETQPIRDPRPLRDPDRFWTRVSKHDGGCWEWTARITPAGYGMLAVGDGKYGYAHRYSYELVRGAIPDGLVIDHLCRNRACVNPEHLEPVTHAENVRRGAAPYGPVRDKCKQGHDITIPENVYTLPGGNHRCRLCAKTHESRRKEARHERGDLRKILKSHCIRGHEFDEANTHVTRGGHRVCRKCSYIRLKSYREKKRAS